MMIAAIVTGLALSGLPADIVDSGEELAFHEQLEATARRADREFSGSDCPRSRVKLLWLTPVRVGDSPNGKGVAARLSVTGCGRSSFQNVNASRSGAGEWNMAFQAPGESLADTVRQRGAMAQVMKSARAELPPGCRGVRIGDIYVSARPGQVDLLPSGVTSWRPTDGRSVVGLPSEYERYRPRVDADQAWIEVWPVELCGKDRATTVIFLPLRADEREPVTLIFTTDAWRDGLAGRPARAR
jgi:hypothetical protein